MALVLAACSGGAPTTAEPEPHRHRGRPSVYTGPAPQSADVQAFEANLWVNISPAQPLRRLPQGWRAVADVRAHR